MAFSIDQQLCQQLQHLDKYDQQTLHQLCQVAFESLKNGATLESLQNEDLKELASQTMSLIVQAVKFGLVDNELNDLLSSIQCNSHYQSQLVQLYQQYKPGLSKVLLAYSALSSYRRYVQVQWKLEVKVASKNIREQLLPRVVLRFHTVDPQSGATTYLDMQCTVADIYHIVGQLEDALRQSSSQHCVKLLRHVK